MKLAEILGQERAVSILRESIARGRLHHALLFSGPEGIGKRTTAFALAARLLCDSEGEDSCGVCPACVQAKGLESGSGTRHPDLYFETLGTNERGKPKKNVSIDQVRELQVALGRSALAGGKKIAIIDEAQALSDDAQNALLKTLEEPPGDTLLVLVAHNASALTATIRSRCQHVPFAPLPAEAVEQILAERHGKSRDEARWLAARAEGSAGAALSVDAAKLREAEKALRDLLDGWTGRGYGEVASAAQSLAGEPAPLGLPLLIRMLRLRLRAAAGLEPTGELTLPAKTVTLGAALSAAEQAYRTSVDLRANANVAIALDRMWLRIGETLGR